MSVDLSRMSNSQLHALNDWEKTHGFFIKYQGRFVYDSDKDINAANNPVEFSNAEKWLGDISVKN